MAVNFLYSNIRKCTSVCKPLTQVCIVGAGPAGFYAAMHLTKKLKNVNIDILEKLPVPFGLIRYGVAPDHPEVKNVINSFTKVAEQENVNFYGNITLGKDVTLAQLRQHYNAVLLTYGAEEDKILGVENENTENVIPARRLVGWYNGLPGDKDLKVNLSGDTAVILGQGNVAMDVARILLSPLDLLRKTDITEHSLNVLAKSKIKQVYLVGRRGPLHAAFTIKELREQIKMKSCRTIWRTSDFNGVEKYLADVPRPRKRLTELMLKSVNEMNDQSAPSNDEKLFRPIFHRSPMKFVVDENTKLKGVELSCNKLVGNELASQTSVSTEEKEFLNCSVAFRSIGYRSLNLDNDIQFDQKKGLVINSNGRVVSNKDSSSVDWGLYVGGWLGTGPVGVIINTMSNAFHVASVMCEDIHCNKLTSDKTLGGFQEVRQILINNDVKYVDWSGWKKIDNYEVETGKKNGKPREKVCTIEKMLEVAI